MSINPENRSLVAASALALPLALGHLSVPNAHEVNQENIGASQSIGQLATIHCEPIVANPITPATECVNLPEPSDIGLSPPKNLEIKQHPVPPAAHHQSPKPPLPPPDAKTDEVDSSLDEDFDDVAHFESGGDWHDDTGNGYYGGLQFSASTWDSFGGTEFAPRADLATEEQQKTVAERVLKVQGWGAWPVTCHLAGVC